MTWHPKVARDHPRRATDPTPDVEHAIRLGQLDGVGERERRGPSERVELLDQREGVSVEVRRVKSRLGEPEIDHFHEISAAVVHLHRVGSRTGGRYGSNLGSSAEYPPANSGAAACQYAVISVPSGRWVCQAPVSSRVMR